MTHETMQKAENLDRLIRTCNMVLDRDNNNVRQILDVIQFYDLPLSFSESDLVASLIKEIEKIKSQAQKEFDEL